MYSFQFIEHNINGDGMNNFKQEILCSVTDCVHCMDGMKCALTKIQITKDIRNENTMYNTICQSYEEEK